MKTLKTTFVKLLKEHLKAYTKDKKEKNTNGELIEFGYLLGLSQTLFQIGLRTEYRKTIMPIHDEIEKRINAFKQKDKKSNREKNNGQKQRNSDG